jgi:type III secretion protein S
MVDLVLIFKLSLLMVLKLSMPPLIAAIVSGVLISLVQTLFQIQDQTLPFAIKLVSVGVVLAMMGGWIGSELMELSATIFRMIPDVEP